MKPAIIVDAGPLVAYFDRDAEQHLWVREQAEQLPPGWLTSEAVLSEAAHLLRRYRDRPMSLADATLVRLSELYENCQVLTLDSDFTIYRRFERRPIPVLMPPTKR